MKMFLVFRRVRKIYFDCSLKQFEREMKKYHNSSSTNEILLFYISKSLHCLLLGFRSRNILFCWIIISSSSTRISHNLPCEEVLQDNLETTTSEVNGNKRQCASFKFLGLSERVMNILCRRQNVLEESIDEKGFQIFHSFFFSSMLSY